MTISEAAQRVGKSESALRRAIKSKKLDAQMVNGKYDLTEEALYAYAKPAKNIDAPKRGAEEIERLREENETLRRELEDTRNKIEELQETVRQKDEALRSLEDRMADASQRHDTVVMQISRMLEYERQPFWRRWFKHKALPAPVDVIDMEPGTDEEATSGENPPAS